MARKTVKVDIPDGSPHALLELIDKILEKHNKDPQNSPLDEEDVKILEAMQKEGAPMRKKAKELDEEKQALNNQVSQLLGIGKGQNRETPGTGGFAVTGVRDTLLKKYRGIEENLSQYGFNVVIGEAKSPIRKPKE